MAVRDVVQIPGEPPLGGNGISPEWLRQQTLFNQQVIAYLEQLESQQNVARKD